MPAYRLIRSKRRTLSLEITPEGEVIVRAPNRLPQAEIQRFVKARAGWIAKHLARPRTKPQDTGPFEEAALKAAARALLPTLVARYARLLQVTPRYVKITSAQKRFGSCNAKGGLCFSWRLMRYPLGAIEYVAAHEAAHLRQMNHGPGFYHLLEGIMPDYRARAALLKQTPK